MSRLFKCRVCGGSGLLQHTGGPEYATHCTECENEEMQQVSELDEMLFELRRGINAHGSTPLQCFHLRVAGMLETLAGRR